ncbi:transcriptional regulator, TrmB [Halococcus morrhuae DSM 1307]|uniref:Transcriptional regulator, TrmB n=2 Tax=Halococcus TaxID=2249 RepID=M0MCI5_HALMO|nr:MULTISPECIES: hypothetical protein [Halococcus]EMA43472.1 transcriptional regulator, TrmB [Halococcus morrhuae DSM 1307]UOO95191.1 transcriptional regulator TrmB [Halococcus dombrowskii]
MSTAKTDPERAVDEFIAVADLLDEPRLARLYTHVLRGDDLTIDDIVAETDIPRTTAYSDAASLVDLGVLTRDDTQKTHTYTAHPVVLTMVLDEGEYTISPTFIDAIGRLPRDQDLSLLVEKHGVGKLAAALTYAIPYTDGEMTERIAARELNLQPAFGIAVLHALQAVVLDMEAYDPYFDQLWNARDTPPREDG